MKWSAGGDQLNAVIDAAGNQTSFDYNSDNTLNETTDAEGHKTVYTYGVSGLRQPTVIKFFDTDGTTLRRQQEFVYDTKGRTLEERQIDPTNGTTVLQKTTRSYYSSGDGNGLLQSHIQIDLIDSSNNTSTTYTYDVYGRVIKTKKSSLFGSCAFTYTV